MSDSSRDRSSVLRRARPVLVLVGILWTVEIVDLVLATDLDDYGIIPRTQIGLRGVLFAPFLHAGFPHLVANTVPLFFLGWLANLGSRRSELDRKKRTKGRGLAFTVLVAELALLSGLGTWAIADVGAPRPGIHVGASSLIFGFFGFVVARGLFELRLVPLLLALLAVVLYGGILYGVVPSAPWISWEGHLAGLVAGVLVAFASARARRARG